MKRNLYALGMLVSLLVFEMAQAAPLATPTEPFNVALFAPRYLESTLFAIETNVQFGVSNDNGRGTTEIYRSLTEIGGYELIATFPYTTNQFNVYDPGLKPRTTYWYTFRVVDGGEASGVAMPISVTTYSNFYNPDFSASGVGAETMEIVLTDNSYYDLNYTIERLEGSSWIYVTEFSEPDSGNVVSYLDEGLQPGTDYTYSVTVTVNGEGQPTYNHIVQATGQTLLDIPELKFGEPYFIECGSRIPLLVETPNAQTSTQIFRAVSATGPYALITTLPPGEFVYTDDVNPRTTYFYKARAVGGSVTSEFSGVISRETISDYYEPGFTVQWNETGVEIKLTDKSYADESYRIEKLPILPESNFEVIAQLALADSGQVYSYIDTNVLPGVSYTYFLSGKTTEYCEAWPWNTPITEIIITIPEGDDYSIRDFTLVNPRTNQDIGQLTNGAAIDVSLLANIRANTSSLTKSVVFYLNGKKVIDSKGPIFSYWSERNGKYSPGLSKPGHYVLEATPLSEKNGRGTKGTTVRLEFDVKKPEYKIYSFTLVDPFTNEDIGPLTNGSVVDASRFPNIRANASSNTKSVLFVLNRSRRVDSKGPTFTYWPERKGDYLPGLHAPGHYELEATAASRYHGKGDHGKTVRITFDIREDDYKIYNFTLVDPATNKDIGPLEDGAVVDASKLPNIRANASKRTKGVEFRLNQKRSTDKRGPVFTVWPESKGDYLPGVSAPGHYILEATPFSEDHGKIKKGPTVRIQFDVTDPAEQIVTTEAANVNLFPNPVIGESKLLIEASKGSRVSIQLFDQYGIPLQHERDIALDADGKWNEQITNTQLKTGIYVVRVTVDGKQFIKRFAVK